MVIPRLNTCNIRQGGSAALAVVVTAALIGAPTEHRQLPTEIHQVQLAAAVLGAVGDTAAPQPASPEALSDYAPEPAAFAIEVQDAVPTAAATEDNFFDTPLGTVVLLANFAALPLWFFFTPITLPLSMLAGASAVTMDGPFGTLQFLIATGLAFIAGPVGLLSIFMNSSASAAATSIPAAGRSVAVEALPNGVAEVAATSAPAVAAVEDDFAAVPGSAESAEKTSTVERTRGRLVERPVGTSPRAAASMTTAAPAAAESAVESLTGQPVEGTLPSLVGGIEQASSSTPEGPCAKSGASKSGSRR